MASVFLASKSRGMLCTIDRFTQFPRLQLGPKNVQEKQTLSTTLGNVFIENGFLQMNNGKHTHRTLRNSSTKQEVSHKSSEEMAEDSLHICSMAGDDFEWYSPA